MGRYLKVSETASLLGTTPKSVRRRIERGELPYRRWGRRVLIPADELESFLRGLPGKTADEALAVAEEGRRGQEVVCASAD